MNVRLWDIRFTVEGLNIERFIRLAGEAHIELTGLRRLSARRLTALAPEADLPRLRSLADSGGWTLRTGQRTGLGRAADRLHAHWLLCCAACAALVLLTMATQAVWRIEVVDGGTYAADVRQALAELGVQTPVLRKDVDLGQLRDALEWRYPRVAWVECGFRGVRLTIRLVEGVLPNGEAEDGPCDVIASRDGVIHHIVTRAGTPAVAIGDVVRKGDVLIRGEERTSDGLTRPVAARGAVVARVWQGANVRMPVHETITTYTGQTEPVWTVRTPWFDLWQMPDTAFAHQDVAVTEMPLAGFFLPVTLHIETRFEAEHAVQRREMEAVKADCLSAAERKLHEKLDSTESLIDIWGNCSMIDDENVSAVAIGEMLVDIGERSSDMAAPEEGLR